MSNEHPHILVVQAQLDAYNAQDLERFCSCYHPRVVIKKVHSPEPIMIGIEEVRNQYKDLFEQHPQQWCQLIHRTMVNGMVVDEELITGRAAHVEGFKAVAIYSFRDGLISEVWFV